MCAVIIILSILLLLFLISLLNIQLIAGYRDRLSIVIKVLFFKIDLSPKKKKPKAKEKKGKGKKQKKTKQKKSDEKEKPKKKKENPLKTLWNKQGVSGFVELLKDVLNLAGGVLKGFFKRFIIHNLDVKISFAGEDASDTATGYGAVCAVVYPLVAQIYSRLNVKDYSVDILCNFEQGAKTELDCSLYGTIRICHIFSITLKAAAKAVKTYLKMRF